MSHFYLYLFILLIQVIFYLQYFILKIFFYKKSIKLTQSKPQKN